jgi:hypothetical protein
MNNSAYLRYTQLQEKEKISFSRFKQFSIIAYIFGYLVAHGDEEATALFLSCLSFDYVPKVKIIKDKNKIKMCVCIKTKELNEAEKNDI